MEWAEHVERSLRWAEDRDNPDVPAGAYVLAREVRRLRAVNPTGPHDTWHEVRCTECGEKSLQLIPAVHVVQVAPTVATLQAKLARVEALPAKWRDCEGEHCARCADELEAALRV